MRCKDTAVTHVVASFLLLLASVRFLFPENQTLPVLGEQ
jgi:hypothetical protein